MQNVDAMYKLLMNDENHYFEACLFIGDKTATPSPNNSYTEEDVYSVEIVRRLFSNGSLSVGGCVSAEIDIRMRTPDVAIPRMAKLVPYVRVTDGQRYSGWVQKGIFYVDTREYNADKSEVTIHGYDAMLMAEKDYTNTLVNSTDIAVVRDIATKLNLSVDSRTTARMVNGYAVPKTDVYTMRETLGYIAAMYGGNFIITETGGLRLVHLNEMPAESWLLVDSDGDYITFGGDRIIVR